MKLYGGIDLHSNNSVIGLLNEEDQMIYQRRLGNDLSTILEALEPYRAQIQGLAVESTYNLVLVGRRLDGRVLSSPFGQYSGSETIRRVETWR